MRLQGKVVLVTGSESGIGKAIATRSVAEGARVVIHGLSAERAAEVANGLGQDAIWHADDLLDPEAASRLVAVAMGHFGQLDCVVNNAAISARGTLEETDAEFFDQVLSINARAPLLIIQAGLPYLQQTQGCVLNIGSGNAYCGESSLLAYSMSKGALTTMTRNLGDALHGQYGVRVNQINPGWVLTEAEDRIQQQMGEPADWHHHATPHIAPAGRLITPEEIATGAVYWMGDESRPISGSVVDLIQYPMIGRNLPKQFL